MIPHDNSWRFSLVLWLGCLKKTCFYEKASFYFSSTSLSRLHGLFNTRLEYMLSRLPIRIARLKMFFQSVIVVFLLNIFSRVINLLLTKLLEDTLLREYRPSVSLHGPRAACCKTSGRRSPSAPHLKLLLVRAVAQCFQWKEVLNIPRFLTLPLRSNSVRVLTNRTNRHWH